MFSGRSKKNNYIRWRLRLPNHMKNNNKKKYKFTYECPIGASTRWFERNNITRVTIYIIQKQIENMLLYKAYLYYS